MRQSRGCPRSGVMGHAEVPSLPRHPCQASSVRYLHIHTDENGEARFAEGEVSFTSAQFAPPAPSLDVSAAMGVREMMFTRFPAGWSDAAHPAPARQWMLVLSGRGETSAGGETRSWGAGDVVLLEDTTPPGHATTILEDTLIAVVRL